MKNLAETPKIYVGTYGKYNSGSLYGEWLDLSEYADLDEFYEACYQLHSDELESEGFQGELMFQDWEYIPSFLISESSLDKQTFLYFEYHDAMDDTRAEGFALFCEREVSDAFDVEQLRERFEESYQGYFSGSDPQLDFAYQYIDDTGMLANVTEAVSRYFGYEAFARDLFLDGYSQVDGHVFADY